MLNRRELFKQTGLAAPWVLLGGMAAPATAQQPGLIVHSQVPLNAEPPLDRLVASWITPGDSFYVRSHAPVPEIDVDAFRLSIEGLVEQPLQLSLAELKRNYPKRSMLATMVCAGNRRNEHSLIKPVAGVPWRAGAIGNLEWAGVALRQLLERAGVQRGAKHVWFEGVDEVQRPGGSFPFGASIPLEKALQDDGESATAMIAYEANGAPLAPDHGYPLRAVVPGYIGARSVKWLGKVIVRDRPSTNHFVATAYKLVQEDAAGEWDATAPIGAFPINSVTCIPAAGSPVPAGTLDVKGYALAAGLAGRVINRVELSVDDGASWTRADCTSPARPFCWRLWQGQVRVGRETSQILVRATDSAGLVQPEFTAWNLKGYLFNGWHRTPIQVR